MSIEQVITSEQIQLVRTLFVEYAAWLAIDLTFQGFASELAALPGAYAPPRGRLLLAVSENDAAGCIALRPLSEMVCEMKRLFVRPEYRRDGLGRRLTNHLVQEAHTMGYRTMKLDTLPWMQSAIRLYETVGFVRCASYYSTPLVETVFMELHL